MLPYSEQSRFSKNIPQDREREDLDEFFENAYHDMRFFLRTITRHKANSYTFFGDLQKQLYYISDNLKEEFGFESNIVQDFTHKWGNRIYRDNAEQKYKDIIKKMGDEKLSVFDYRYQVQNKNGQILWVRCCSEVQWDEEKTKPLFVAGRITKQDDRFVVDPITNFPSGSAMLNHLSEIQERNIPAYAVGYCFNNMVQINAMMGRVLVDQLIYDISEQLMDELCGQATFYRLPGIRCMVIVEKPQDMSAEDLIAEIKRIADKNYVKYGVSVPKPCSFAIMKLPQKNMEAEEIRERMVSLIKMARHNTHVEYMEDSEENTEKIIRYTKIEMMICQDVLNDMKNFRAVVQPVVSTETGEITAGETLMRWRFEEKDISPAVFIPILEKNNMIHIAGKWIFEQAVAFCSKVIHSKPDFYLSVNVSLEQLYDEEFIEFIPKTLEKYHLDGSHIVMEMTESCMDTEPQKLYHLMSFCKTLGIRFALDDFGTGYSSMRVLLHYPTDIIKLDRSLLLEMIESRDKMNFISSIVFACHRFDRKVCIEGVEDDMQDDMAKVACCDMIQGFYYYKPTELDDLLKIMTDHN